ncbi:hypothetical protein [Roseimarinus sediminis]|uniref:hypothetical protein n=1 Tax=Roseimarinus sediminis TaxID=1610899 RepID=UPI003D1C642C
MKNIKNYTVNFLTVLFFLLFFSSCEKEVIIEDPTPVYDHGERLILNNDLLILDNSELTFGGQQGVSYDDATEVLKFDEAGIIDELETDLDTGMVLLIKMEKDVLLRKITEVTKNGGEYELKTSPGSISHIFDNARLNFDFSPDYSYKKMQSMRLSTMNDEELSAALTDKDKRIHPSEISMKIGGKKELLFSVSKEMYLPASKSASMEQSFNENNKVGFSHQFDDPFSIPLHGPVELVLEDFGFSWYSKLSAEYSKSIGFTSQSASFKVIASDMDIEAWFDAALIAEGEVPLVNDESQLLLPVVIQFTFPVATIPVVIDVEFALNLGTEITLDGKARISSGYTVKYNIPRFEIGAHAHHWDNWKGDHLDWGPVFNYEKGHISDQHFHPLTIEAMATLKQVYTIKPTMGFAIYAVAGPEINMAIGAEYDFSVGAGARFDVEGTKAPETYIGWGANLASRIGIGGGAWIDLKVVNKHWDIPTLPVLPNIPIWHTPESMEKKSDNDFAQTIVGASKEVEVEVKDSWTLPAPAMFVEWVSDGGGYWEYPITLSGLGTTKNTWHPTEAGEFAPYCYVKNGSLEEKGRVTFNTTTKAN